MPAHIPRPEYVDQPAPTPYDGPEVKDAETIERMRVAGRLAAQALQLVSKHVAPGITSDPVSRAGPGRSTYSGRSIDAGTGRRGDTTPGATLA